MARNQSVTTSGAPSARAIAAWGVASVGLAVVGVAAGRLAIVHRRTLRATRPGRTLSASHAANASRGQDPLTTFNHHGHIGDPINVQVVGTNGQLGASFSAAGWYRADETGLLTSARISVDSMLSRVYSAAPVSDRYLFGRKEDYAFERPGPNVRERDHIRFWNTGRVAPDSRPIWIGSATKDVAVELSHTTHLPTHRIGPDLDAERALVISELAQSGYVIGEGTRPGFGKETHGVNGGGDPYFTDGMIAELRLADVRTHPLATHVRGPLGARIARFLERLARNRLPREGLERAERELARLGRSSEGRRAPIHEPTPAR